jgi:DNA-binding MarR family transcriptional regulator
MAHSTRLLVLHALRLRSVAPADEVARRYSLDDTTVAEVLDRAVELGWVRRSEGVLSGYTLTVAGRTEGARLLDEELTAAGSRAAIEAGYHEFMTMNGELLAICTDWQVMVVDGVEVVNDHLDAERDGAIVARLDVLAARTGPVLQQLAAALARFEGYGSRLAAAHERIIGGETEWLTRPTIDSYHTVWFELHEDLLATLGRRRSDERHEPAGSPSGAAPAGPGSLPDPTDSTRAE